jgi:TonB-linked SusC/RagA family outer membrane protein
LSLLQKKGKAGSKLSIEYDAFSNFQGRPDLGYQKYLNSPQFIQAAKETFSPDDYTWEQATAYSYGGGGVAPHLRILYDQSRGLISEAEANSRLAGLASIDNRSQISNLFYRSAILSNHSLSLSGGTDNYSFYTSATYTNNQNTTPGDEDKLYKLNARQDLKINNFISAYAITDFSKSKLSSKRNLNVSSGFLPYQLFRDNDGKNLSMSYMTNLSDEVRTDFEGRSRISLDYNPLDEFNRGSTDTDGFMSRIIGGINVNIIDGLKFVGTYGYIVGNNKTSSFDSQDSYTVRKELVEFTLADTPDDTPVYYLPSVGGRYSEANATQKSYTIRNQVEYDKGWNDEKHHINILLGQEAQENSTQSTTTLVRGYDPSLQTYSYINYETLINDGIENPVMPNSGQRSVLGIDQPRDFVQTDILSRFTSYFSNASYTFNKKYSVNGSIRKDQSNLFALDKSSQGKPVWSVGGKWQISGESFLYDSSVISNLALRATYGVTGNAPSPGTASSYDILSPQLEYAYVGNVVPLTIATPGNKKLTWESTKNINLGLDFTLFGNRIDGSIDFYRKNTDNMIGQLPLNIFTGYVTAIGNFGSMENKGVEVTLNTLNVETKDFSWSTQFVMSYNKNTITQLELPSEVNTGDQKVNMSYMKGYPAYAVFAYNYQGLDASGDPLIKLADGTITKTPNITTADDVVYKGTLAPKWNGGLTNVFTYKGLTLSGTAVYNLGHVMRKDVNTFYSGPLMQGDRNFTGANLHSDFADRWKSPGDELVTDIPRYVPQVSVDGDDRSTNYYTLGSSNILDASYIKFRDITLAYSLPKSVLSKANISSLSFRISMSNVMLWKANKEGIDPEFQSGQVRYPKTGQNAIALGLHLSL